MSQTRAWTNFRPCSSEETIYAKVTYADIAGLDSGAAKSGSLARC